MAVLQYNIYTRLIILLQLYASGRLVPSETQLRRGTQRLGSADKAGGDRFGEVAAAGAREAAKPGDQIGDPEKNSEPGPGPGRAGEVGAGKIRCDQLQRSPRNASLSARQKTP